MLAIKILLYAAAAAVLAFDVYIFWGLAEKIIRALRHQVPFLPSGRMLRDAVVREIKANYPNARTACDIGSGYGGLARAIARECGLCVVALENMPLAALVSKIADIGARGKSKTVWRDAFEYVSESDGFDIAVAYLGPDMGDRLASLCGKIRVLIALDFPIAALRAARTIDLPGGYTRYMLKKYPHKLFVYEF